MNDQEKFLEKLNALLEEFNATLDVEFQSEWGDDVGEIVVNASTFCQGDEVAGSYFELNLGRSHGTPRH